ncbi:MAG TPA: c-type cytochrome [Vicinamibacteria bacterium]
MTGRVIVLAGAALLVSWTAAADDEGRLRAIGEGRALYLTNCKSCHGVDVKGGTAPDLTAIRARDGSFSVLHVTNHITGGRSGGRTDGGMPSWGRILTGQWPHGEGAAALQTWKLAKYVEFVQASEAPVRK